MIDILNETLDYYLDEEYDEAICAILTLLTYLNGEE